MRFSNDWTGKKNMGHNLKSVPDELLGFGGVTLQGWTATGGHASQPFQISSLEVSLPHSFKEHLNSVLGN